ncbi:hypothetical protein JMA_39860 (plasmid) [Jeotgalibacillus malaysiensis]|uniref:Uncharacterized protein n=1 Tax=Jeotgalibacillus malaysiensis TaxID=1508404 RepID=A0A0B5AZD9_9BACL|nr:hypothetical protein [Jeotgalibacillus malaysiensis]AJD93304.1 hypothetical protein JMA_39860 [Jeotgalibacillus malaysiensis]
MLNVFTFIVKGKRTDHDVPMESLGMNEQDALLYLEQQLKKSGFVFDEIMPSNQSIEA